MLGMRTCLPCHISDRWSRNVNRIWPDLAFGFVHKRSGNETRWKQLSCQSDETVREVPSEQTYHDPYEEEVLDPCRFARNEIFSTYSNHIPSYFTHISVLFYMDRSTCSYHLVGAKFLHTVKLLSGLRVWLISISMASSRYSSSFCIIRWLVVGLQISLVGELRSAIAIIFDGTFGKFAFSWSIQNRFDSE